MELIKINVLDYIEANKLRMVQVNEYIPLYEEKLRETFFLNIIEKRHIKDRLSELREERLNREFIIFNLTDSKEETIQVSLEKYGFLLQYVRLD